MSFEQDLIKKIKGGTTAIKNKTKTPKDAGLGKFFTELKKINIGQHDELMENYKQVLNEIKK